MASADGAADSDSTTGASPSSPTAAETRLPSTLSADSSTDSSEGHLNLRGSIRRKLSKQKGIEEAETAPSSLPVLQESLTLDKQVDKEDSPTAMNSRSRQLVRGLALCGDDDTRLRPPPLSLQRHPNSLSHESSGTEYTDSSGIDLRAFVIATLHKNPRDRQMTLWLEQQLTTFVNDDSAQSFKFPQMSSYNRMLIHRIAALFGLDHNVDNSGKSVVVNKTTKTARPDFDFSSLIVGPQYSDHRRGYRSVHSFDEVRDPSLMGYGYGNRLVDNYWNRRTHSYDSPHFGVQNGSAYFYQNNGAQSFEVPGYHQNQADRSAILRKAGSFGGVPTYYRSGSGLDNAVERPANTPSLRDYSSRASMGSPANVAELADGMAGVQMDTHRMQMSPMTNGPREYVYGYQQPMYVNSPTLSPSGYNHPYVVTTTVHQVAVPANGHVPYVTHPQAYFSPGNGYVEPDCTMYPVPGSYSGYSQASPVPVPYVMPQPYYECAEYPPESMNSDVTSEEGPVQTTVPHPISLDGGYGSLTHQDSLREETEHTQ